MELFNFLKLLKRKKQTIGIILSFCMFLTFVVTVIPVFEYQTDSRILLVQKGLSDPYAIVKSNEYFAALFKDIIISDDFLKDVFKSDFYIDKSYFSELSDNEKRDLWKKSIELKALNESGIMEISVFHDDQGQSGELAKAINSVLLKNHQKYYSENVDLNVQLLAGPVTSNFPTRPNFLLNFVLGFGFALLISFSYVCFFPEKGYDLKIFSKKKLNNNKIEALDFDIEEKFSISISN